MKRRRLLFDIETSLGKFYAHRCGYNINLLHHQIIEEPKIICISYKWHGQSKVYCLDWGKKRCDKELLKKFIKIAESADELIGHNSDQFDLKYIRTRCFFHRIPMMPDFTTVDTYKESGKFRFQSRGLDYINKFGGHAGKTPTEWDLWVKTTEGNPSALRDMKKYCNRDVTALEQTYDDLRPYMKPKTSVAKYRCDCPECGSEEVKLRSNKISGAGIKYKQMQCYGCGTYFKLSESIDNGAKKKKRLDREAEQRARKLKRK